MSERETIEVYHSHNYHIFARLSSRTGPIIISFVGRDGTTKAASEATFAKYAINAVHVTCRGPHWFQYADSCDAAGAIRRFCASFDRRICTGISMGGYGALMFSGLVEADLVLSWSPQYSVDHDKVPFEHRWDGNAQEIRNGDNFIFDNMAEQISKTADIVIIYDPFDNDARHVDLLRCCGRPFKSIRVPFSWHAAIRVVREVGLASTILRDAVAGSLDVVGVRNAIRRNRYSSPYYLRAAARALSRHNRRGVVQLIHSAIRVAAADDYDGIWNDARLLLQYGDETAAVAQILTLYGLPRYLARPNSVNDSLRFAPALIRLERAEAAIALLKTALTKEFRAPGGKRQVCMLHAHLIIARLLAMTGRTAAALTQLEQAEMLGALPALTIPMAELYLAADNQQRALTLLERAHAEMPDNMDVLKRLCDTLEKAGRVADALHAYAAAAACNDLPAAPHRLSYGRLLHRQGRPLEGMREIDTVLRLQPENALAHRLRAICLATLQRHDDACDAFRVAACSQGQRSAALLGLLKSLMATGKRHAALPVAREAAALLPGNATVARALAELERQVVPAV